MLLIRQISLTIVATHVTANRQNTPCISRTLLFTGTAAEQARGKGSGFFNNRKAKKSKNEELALQPQVSMLSAALVKGPIS